MNRTRITFTRADSGSHSPELARITLGRTQHGSHTPVCDSYITPELADFLFENQIDMQKEPARLLSDREVQVVRSLAAGQRATEIASELGLSVSTVNTFVQRTKEKLGARTVVEIVQFAQDNGLLG